MTVKPMFPLGTVLLPGAALPLHVFEPRYRQLVIECLQADGPPQFGQVLITHGSEAGGGDQRAMVATLAEMAQVQALDESRYALVAVGVRRIRINKWLHDDPYPRAEVEDWPDEESEPVTGLTSRVDVAEGRVSALVKLFAEVEANEHARDDEPLATESASSTTALANHPVVATYQLASRAPIGPADRYRLLAVPGLSARLDVLDEVIDDVEAVLKFRLI